MFITFESAKIIWERPKVKYGADDVEKKKDAIGEWLQFKITDDKPIMKQVHLYENLCAEILNENVKMCEILHPSVLIEKSLPSWSDY